MPSIGDINEKTQFVDSKIFYTYTQIDFSRWDSFEPKFAAYSPAIKSNINKFKFTQSYLEQLKQRFLKDYLLTSQQWWVGFVKNNNSIYDIINVLRTNQLNTTDLLLYCSHSLNHCYNVYRNSLISKNISPDTITEINWLSLPLVESISNYIENWILTFFSVQSLVHNFVNTPRGRFDTFGVFALSDSFGKKLDPNLHFWYVSSYSAPCCRYSHLFKTKTLRYLRKGFMASLSALHSWLNITGTGYQSSTAQWLTRICGWTLSCTFLIQSERLIRSRNEWTDSTDLIQKSDKVNGLWTTNDALEFCVALLKTFVDHTSKNGITEYLSCYYGFVNDQISMALVHSPNEQVYNLWNIIAKYFWYDISVNYLIPSSTLSGCTNRDYGLITQTNSNVNRYDIQVYIEPLFTSNVLPFNSSDMNTNNLKTASLELPAIRIFQMLLTLRQLSSIDFYTPENALSNLCLRNTYHITRSKFSPTIGSERFNFITPYFSIGHAGNYTYNVNNQMLFVARLAGKPIQKSNNISANCLPLIQIISTTNSNDLFSNKNGVMLANDQLASRQFVSQYQGFCLVSQLIESSHVDPTNSVGISTNILLPLNVDGGIFVNNTRMNSTYGTLFGISEDSIITVRHQNASVVIRILLMQHDVKPSPNRIQQVTDLSVMNMSKDNPSLHPYSLMYQIDREGLANGCARLIITHRHRNSSVNKSPYYVNFLITASITRNDNERILLENVVRDAVYKQSFSDTLPLRDIYTSSQVTYNCEVKISNNLTLSIYRTDCRTKNNNDLIFKDCYGAFHQFPYLTTAFNRKVNGVDMFKFSQTDSAFITANLKESDLYLPHLGKNIVNTNTVYQQFNSSNM